MLSHGKAVQIDSAIRQMIQAAYVEVGAATAMKPNRKDAVVLIP
jgi:hypothetical protein